MIEIIVNKVIKEWTRLCDEMGCAKVPYHQALLEYANLPGYLRCMAVAFNNCKDGELE